MDIPKRRFLFEDFIARTIPKITPSEQTLKLHGGKGQVTEAEPGIAPAINPNSVREEPARKSRRRQLRLINRERGACRLEFRDVTRNPIRDGRSVPFHL